LSAFADFIIGGELPSSGWMLRRLIRFFACYAEGPQ